MVGIDLHIASFIASSAWRAAFLSWRSWISNVRSKTMIHKQIKFFTWDTAIVSKVVHKILFPMIALWQ